MQSRSNIKAHQIPLLTGVSIELSISEPVENLSSNEKKLAVCLHPWSWLGGQMNDPVLLSLTESFHDRGYHILRYNSRGVGRSTGRSTFTGFDEGKDLEAIVQWAMQQLSTVVSVVILGYSHGSLIASLHPVLAHPVKTSHVLVSYPLGPRGWLTMFHSTDYTQRLEDLLRNRDSKILVVYGDQDEFTSSTSYSAWVSQLQAVAAAAGNLQITQVYNASHFWQGQAGDELAHTLQVWLT